MNTPPQADPNPPRRERGTSGFGILVTIGTFAAAAVGGAAFLATLHITLPVILAAGAGLALLGGGLMVAQHHKEKVNDAHAERSYARHKGYHKEPERIKDDSLIHLMKGPSDLPERVKYLEDSYGAQPLSANQYRSNHMGMGIVFGLVAGLAVGAAFGALSVPLGVLMGVLAGGTTVGVHTAGVMKNYEKYLDGIAKEERAKAAQRGQSQPIEYDNERSDGRSYAADVIASRQPRGVAEASR